MTYQQINLYQPIFRKERKIFSSLTMLQVCVIVVVGLSAIYAYSRAQVASLAGEVGRLQTMEQRKAHHLEALGREFPPPVKSRRLEAEVRHLSGEVRTKRAVLTLLSSRRFGNTTGFSAHLAGLARRDPRGVWLTGIDIEQGGTRLELTGSALRPALVPRLLTRLAGEPAFHGRSFDVFRMSRPRGNPGWIDFTVRTVGKEPPR